jgi:hypothetical protein
MQRTQMISEVAKPFIVDQCSAQWIFYKKDRKPLCFNPLLFVSIGIASLPSEMKYGFLDALK